MAKKKTKKKSGKTGKATEKKKGFWQQPNNLIWLGAILLITFLSFTPALENDFVNWDDDVNLYENPNLERFDWESVKSIFTSRVLGNYNPLPIFTFAVEKHLFGAETAYLHHLTNVLLHLLCVFFVFRIGLLLGLKLPFAALPALLFGIHPMRVESVAWITERKDVLLGAFYFSAFYAYLKYLLSNLKSRGWWALCLGLFFIGLFAKIQMVALPLAMLAADYYYNRKLSFNLVIEKWPFFLLSLVFGLAGIYFLSESGSLGSVDEELARYSFGGRLLIGAYSFVVYLIKVIYPYEMSPLYPYPSGLSWPFYLAPVIVVAVFVGVWLAYLKEMKALVFGFAFFFFNVVFLLQVVGAGQGFIADRFTYIPYMGLFFIAAFYIEKYSYRNKQFQPLFPGIAVLYLIGSAFLTYNQCKVWKNGETLWKHVLEHYNKTTLPYRNLGYYYKDNGRFDEALECYNQAIRLRSDQPEIFNSRGDVHFKQGKFFEAVGDYEIAIELDKNKAEYLANRGVAYGAMGKHGSALNDFNAALQIDPTYYKGILNKALVFYQMGDYNAALNEYNKYLEIDPDYADIWYEKALCYRHLRAEEDALEALSRAITLDDSKPLYWFERAKVRAGLGDKEQARVDVQRAQALGMQIPADVLKRFE